MTVKTATRKTPQPSANGNGLSLPNRWVWTVEEFQRAYDLGVFGYDARLELIEGEIIRKMPQSERHAWGVRAAQEVISRLFVEGHDIRVQMPLGLSTISGPEPDVAVVVGTFNDYKRAHPKTAVLVVEVSDSTLAYDRSTKAALYARAGVPEYWIVNLPDGVLEVHRQPAPMADQPLGHHYRSITRLTPNDTLSPLARPDVNIEVSTLLP